MCYVAAESVNTTIAVTIRFRFIIFSQIHISVSLDMHIFCIFQVIAYSCSHFLYIIYKILILTKVFLIISPFGKVILPLEAIVTND